MGSRTLLNKDRYCDLRASYHAVQHDNGAISKGLVLPIRGPSLKDFGFLFFQSPSEVRASTYSNAGPIRTGPCPLGRTLLPR